MATIKTIEKMIKESLLYDPKTGSLTWLERPVYMFSNTNNRTAEHCAANWNSRFAYSEAFTSIGSHGYRTGTVAGRRFLLHRVAFFIQTGGWPKQLLDHINGDKLDNRWSNLREANHFENAQNKRRHGKTSSFIGVCWNKRLGGYVGKVHHRGKDYYCGFSKDHPEKIARKRDAKALELFGKYARLNFEMENYRD